MQQRQNQQSTRALPTGRHLQRERYTGTKTRSLSLAHSGNLCGGGGAGRGGGALFSRRNVSVKVREVLRQAAVPSVMQLTLLLGATLSWLKEGRLPEPAGTLGRCNLLPAAPKSTPSGVLSHWAHLPLHSLFVGHRRPRAEGPDWARSTVLLSPSGLRWIPSAISVKTFFSRNQCLSWFKKISNYWGGTP